jgi:predicted nucleotidyltransferase
MNKTSEHIRKLIRSNIAEIDPAAQVILYGSRARGDARKDSDWDILVLTNYPVDFRKEKLFRDHLYELEIQTGEPLSIFVYSLQDWNTKQRISPYFHNITKQGILL